LSEIVLKIPKQNVLGTYESREKSQIRTKREGGQIIMKVKTFTCPMKIFKTKGELDKLDKMVNQFIKEKKVKKIISVSDTCTTDDSGATIGLIRVVAYE
jgi:hypothetical protein